jgi:hypothetical protein
MGDTTRITGREAIEVAEAQGLLLSTYSDPTEGGREGVSVEDAREIAREDPSLVYLDITETFAARERREQGELWGWHPTRPLV